MQRMRVMLVLAVALATLPLAESFDTDGHTAPPTLEVGHDHALCVLRKRQYARTRTRAHVYPRSAYRWQRSAQETRTVRTNEVRAWLLVVFGVA